jgi:hypothetical protein
MLVGAAANALDHLAGIGERLLHQFRDVDLLGDALREQIAVSAPRLQRGLLARRSDIGIVEADRRPEDFQLLLALRLLGHGRSTPFAPSSPWKRPAAPHRRRLPKSSSSWRQSRTLWIRREDR